MLCELNAASHEKIEIVWNCVAFLPSIPIFCFRPVSQ